MSNDAWNDVEALLVTMETHQVAKVFALADGLTWRDSAGRTFTVARPELKEWIGNRAEAGRLPPKGFPKSNRFEG